MSAISLLKSFDTKLSYISSKAVAKQRQSVCADCPRHNMGACLECGCILLVKTRLAAEKCPLGKW